MRRITHVPAAAAFAAVAVLVAGCGGGGLSSGKLGTTTAAPEDQIVAAYDQDNDGNQDLLTLNPNVSPMQILGAIQGQTGGGFVDVSAQLAGQPIDANISAAISNYLANSVELGAGTDLEVQDVSGRALVVTVYE
jgi:hypothetical protein